MKKHKNLKTRKKNCGDNKIRQDAKNSFRKTLKTNKELPKKIEQLKSFIKQS